MNTLSTRPPPLDANDPRDAGAGGGLRRLFRPESIAVVGASSNPAKLGYTLVQAIVGGGYRGRVHLVNPSATSVLGLPCVASPADLPTDVDLAIVMLPAGRVPGVLRELAARRVFCAVVPAGGFAETGSDGRRVQDEIREICASTGLRVLGPNVPGFINADAGLVATFAGGRATPGPLAIVSQAGSVAYLLARNLHADAIHFGRFICLGNKVDIDDGEVIDYLGTDPGVAAIGLYVESVVDGAGFLRAAARVSSHKPVVALKGGRTRSGAKAIFSHTASISSPDRIYAAAFRKAGIVQVDDARALGPVAFALASQGRSSGNRVAIVTSLAGVGVLAADACERSGLSVPAPSKAIRDELTAVLPPMGSVGNPIDLTGDVNPDMLRRSIEILSRDDTYDIIVALVMGVPGSRDFGNGAYAEAVRQAAVETRARGKAIAAGWVMDEAGGEELAHVRRTLHEVGVPVCLYPEDAVGVARGLWQRGRLLDERAPLAARAAPMPWRRRLQRLRERHGLALGEHLAKAALESAGLALAPSRLATSAAEAVAHAEAIGFPVVLKVQSQQATHKSDGGGVALDVASARQVRATYAMILRRFAAAAPDAVVDGVSVQPMVREPGVEMLCGVADDPQFGKYLMIGIGGVAVEALADVAIRLLPVNASIVARMLGELGNAALLRAHRGRPGIDVAAFCRFATRLARLAGAPEIAELECNPVLATATGAIALDARIRLTESHDLEKR